MGNFNSCPTVPFPQAGKFSPIFPCTEILEGYIPGQCVSDIFELACVAQSKAFAMKGKITVCPKAVIDFEVVIFVREDGDEVIGPLTVSVPDGCVISCPTLDCILRRPWLNNPYDQNESFCPYFTTQIGNELQLEGFTYGTGFVDGGEFSFASTENLVALSNYDLQFDSKQVDIDVESSLKRSKVSKKGTRRHLMEDENNHSPNSKNAHDLINRGRVSRRSLLEPSKERCTSDKNWFVEAFVQADTDGDGALTCPELQSEIDLKMPGAVVKMPGEVIAGPVVDCLAFFTGIAFQQPCFELDADDNLLLISTFGV